MYKKEFQGTSEDVCLPTAITASSPHSRCAIHSPGILSQNLEHPSLFTCAEVAKGTSHRLGVRDARSKL